MPVKRELNSSDALYAQLRNRNFGDMGPLLQKLSRDVQEGQEERHAAHTVSQLRDFMRKLQQLEAMRKSLSLHVSLAERLQRHTAAPAFHARIAAEQEALANAGATADAEAALDGAIGRAEPLPSVLRLACLHSILASGLKEKKLAALHAEVLSEYGYSAASLSLNALHKVGLLRRHDARSGWPSLRKALDLVADDVPEVEGLSDLPSALSYYYSGYCPLSTRLVGWMLARAPHWSSRAEALGRRPDAHSFPRPAPWPADWPVLLRRSAGCRARSSGRSHPRGRATRRSPPPRCPRGRWRGARLRWSTFWAAARTRRCRPCAGSASSCGRRSISWLRART
mmetsp:Transcript_24321/g.72126  ORF Transcript_24321/g.72126 Transcript_24321/m.72126 type:complete len:340 (+) Transcript_24321:844-1863(+)